MTKTKRETVSEALRHIGVLGTGDTADAETYDRAASHYDSAIERIETLHDMSIPFSDDAVPDWAFPSLAMMVAGLCCTGFQKPEFRGEYRKGLRDFIDNASIENDAPGRPAETVYY